MSADLKGHIQPRRNAAGKITSYRVGWREAGRLCWSPGFATVAGAEEFQRLGNRLGWAHALDVVGRGAASSTAITFGEWFDRHMDMLAAEATEGTLAENRRVAARYFLDRFGALPLDSITREDVTLWVADMRAATSERTGRPLSTKTIRNAHALLSAVLGSAVDHDRIPKNVARGVKIGSQGAREEQPIFTHEEAWRFLAEVPEHYRPMTRVILATGLRIGEATALRWQDVDLDRGTISVVQAWKVGDGRRVLGAPKSLRSRRTIEVDADTVAVLRDLWDVHSAGPFLPSDLVFRAPRGGVISPQHYGTRVFKPAVKRAGITKDLHPHSLRHTHFSWLLMAGVSPIVVQHRAGHESLETTSKVYAHLLTGAQTVAAQAFGAIATTQSQALMIEAAREAPSLSYDYDDEDNAETS